MLSGKVWDNAFKASNLFWDISYAQTLLLTQKDWDRPELHKRSMRLLAEQVMPKLRSHLEHVKAAE